MSGQESSVRVMSVTANPFPERPESSGDVPHLNSLAGLELRLFTVFNLRRKLTTPLNCTNPGLELTPVDYVHHAVVTNVTRAITVRAPLTWTVSYWGYSPIDAFEEVAKVSDLAALRGPFKERLLAIARANAPSLATF